jgi:AraC-like DNA-binding protein
MNSTVSLPSAGHYDDFAVSFAERRDVGDEWNLIEWNKKHLEIDCHRLYYRTDPNGGKATLHLIDRTIELETGKLYFIPAFTILQSKINGRMNKYYIHFRSNSPELRLHRFLSNQYFIDSTPMTEALFETVIENYTKNTVQAKMKVDGAMQLLLSDFFKESSSAHKDLARFESILSYIEENYNVEIPISLLAAKMNVSTLYFSNYFKATFHISPKQYILNKRLAEGQRLLLETDMTIREIANSVGFANENYFSEFFASKIGISASRYRKRALPKERVSIL